MGSAHAKQEGAIHRFAIYPDTSGVEQVPRTRRVLNQPCLIENSRDRHVLRGDQPNLRQILGQFAIFHTIASRAMRGCCSLFAVEAGNNFLGQLNFDVTRISSRRHISPEAFYFLH